MICLAVMTCPSAPSLQACLRFLSVAIMDPKRLLAVLASHALHCTYIVPTCERRPGDFGVMTEQCQCFSMFLMVLWDHHAVTSEPVQ